MIEAPSADCAPGRPARQVESCPACSVIIPFFNEEQNVAPLLRELWETLVSLDAAYEVILVDDGSTDGTAEELRKAAAGWEQCTVVAFERNRGQAAALMSAFGRANGRVFVTLDGDGQNDPADIPRLLARLEGADMVAGVRTARKDSLLRRAMSRVANAIRSRVLSDGVRDTGCALKAFRREVAGAFLPMRTLYSFMPALAVAAGFRVVEEPVSHRPRREGKSKYGLIAMAWSPFIDMLGVRWFSLRRVAREDAWD
jgi:glycosyltransferase involved in cell wall biosynthesis